MGAYVVETVRVVMAAGPLVMGMGVVSAAVAEAFFLFPEVWCDIFQGSWRRDMDGWGEWSSSIFVVGLE